MCSCNELCMLVSCIELLKYYYIDTWDKRRQEDIVFNVRWAKRVPGVRPCLARSRVLPWAWSKRRLDVLFPEGVPGEPHVG